MMERMEREDMGEVVAVHFLEKRGLMLQCAADCIYEELKTTVILKAKKTNEVFGYETNSIHG